MLTKWVYKMEISDAKKDQMHQTSEFKWENAFLKKCLPGGSSKY